MRFKTVTTVCCVALLGAFGAPTANGDDWNRKTTMTFSAPVEIPGVHLKGWGVLPAGTYVFKVLDSQSNRHIVQIFSKDERTIYATILAIPNVRLTSTDKTVITFRERPAGRPQALRAWFYPGRTWGEEFVYPKARAFELAKATNEPVLFMPAEIPSEVTEPIKPAAQPVQSNAEPVATELTEAPVQAVTPAGQEVELAQVVTPPPAAETRETPDPATTLAENKLPATASPLPLVGLLGVMALGAALTIGIAAKLFA